MVSMRLIKISEVTEDKKMYDARENTIRDHEWAVIVARDEAKVEGNVRGEIKTIRILQNLLELPTANIPDLANRTLDALQAITTDLKRKLQNRKPSN